MTRHFATYADSNYLGRLKALYASMQRHCGDFVLHVLAWDGGVERWATEQEMLTGNARAVFIDNLIFTYPNLALEALPGPTRTRVEHMWTVGPAFIADVMRDTGQPVTYVDADVMFHSSPEPVFEEIGNAHAGVVPHGFCEVARAPIPTAGTHNVFGLYNVGLVHFRDPKLAAAWAFACQTWCYAHFQEVTLDSTDGILYGDQKYLDPLPTKYGAHVVQHPGACAGPWGVHAKPLELREGVIHFGGRPLVAWHYSGYRELPDGHTVLTRPEYMLTDEQAEILYVPYIRALEAAR